MHSVSIICTITARKLTLCSADSGNVISVIQNSRTVKTQYPVSHLGQVIGCSLLRECVCVCMCVCAERARSCLYHLLLNKHCPLPTATPHTQPHTQPHPPSHAHTDGHRETNQTHTQSGNARPAGAAGAAQQPSVLGRTPTGTQGAVSMSGGQAFAAPAPAFTAGTQGGGGVSVCVSQLRSQLEVAVESQAALMEGHLPQEQVSVIGT